MSGQRIWTAAELEGMAPNERHERFEASIVTDLADAPADIVERARHRAMQHLAEQEDAPH